MDSHIVLPNRTNRLLGTIYADFEGVLHGTTSQINVN